MYLIGCKNLQSLGVSTTDLLYREYTTDVFSCFDDIDGLFKEQQMMALTPDGMEQELFGEAKAEKEEGPAPKVSFVTRLGAKIRELIAKFKEMMTKFLSRFKKEDETMKQQQALIEAAFRQDPTLKTQVIELAKSGNLNFTDIKNINELQAEVEKLMEEKNPTTFKGKFERLKKKWDDPENTKTVKRIKAVGQVAALVTSLLAIGATLSKRKNSIMDNSKNTQNMLNDLMGKVGELGDPKQKKYYKEVRTKNGKMQKVYYNIANNGDDIGLLQMKVGSCKYLSGRYGEALAVLSGDMDQVNGLLRNIIRTVDSTKLAKNKQAKNMAKMRLNYGVNQAVRPSNS